MNFHDLTQSQRDMTTTVTYIWVHQDMSGQAALLCIGDMSISLW
jgi:hypothetical protein